MRKFYLATAMLISTIAATAQTEKGTVNINGSFGSNGGGAYQNNDAFNQFKLNLGAGAGYFVKNNWEIGLVVHTGIISVKYKAPFNGFNSVDRSSNNRLGTSVYSKYYFGTKQIKPFAVLSTGYNSTFTKSTYNGTTIKSSDSYFNYGGGAGLAWFPSRKVGLFTQLTYDRLTSDILNQGSFNLNFGVQINLGKK